jgi:hypothetical protein
LPTLLIDEIQAKPIESSVCRCCSPRRFPASLVYRGALRWRCTHRPNGVPSSPLNLEGTRQSPWSVLYSFSFSNNIFHLTFRNYSPWWQSVDRFLFFFCFSLQFHYSRTFLHNNNKQHTKNADRTAPATRMHGERQVTVMLN